MALIRIDLRSRTPISEQLVDEITRLVLSGMIAPDEQLPSVRALATELGINPNTIQKSYAILEERGILYSAAGRGNFASPDVAKRKSERIEQILAHVACELRDARALGADRAEAEAILENIWRAER